MTYWPTHEVWTELCQALESSGELPEVVDKQPWLFGPEHTVHVIENHEGFDTGAGRLAILGFLPFKHARVAAIIGDEDYSDFLFIAGVPRLPENQWRLDASKAINSSMVMERSIVDCETFGYRKSLENMSQLLFSPGSLLHTSDLHLAILGSKLQTIACWVLSEVLPSITVKTSVPSQYYPEAFSDGIGASWYFPFVAP